ncbi:hypothetical protein CVT24_006890 [Panaeolus cyanescens]|uniref:G domain-containing protein n=1 Tax=Panaeolus cyanescens TaxID=181874 RepID=A0A409W032_9AGAR|nr:hypothetical protein CVT24_006890 [Panaeolus cyanescens]
MEPAKELRLKNLSIRGDISVWPLDMLDWEQAINCWRQIRHTIRSDDASSRTFELQLVEVRAALDNFREQLEVLGSPNPPLSPPPPNPSLPQRSPGAKSTALAPDEIHLKNLEIKGIVSVWPLEMFPWRPDIRRWRILIMGPTGSGKSSFIEAIAGPNWMINKISSGQLEGFTQDVNCYYIENVMWKEYPIYIVDTPGFADTKMSEFEILRKIEAWMSSD